MNRIVFQLAVVSVIVFSSFAICSAAEAIEPKKRIVLFDGKSFDGWFRYLRNNKGDVDDTWKVKSGGILTCAGEPRGYIRTTRAYKNYRLHVEYRWPAKPGNNGILVHMVGEDKVWPKCVEAQLMHENAGDFWLLSFSAIKADGKQVGPKQYANAKKMNPSNEKPAGQWNSYDIVCDGKTVTLSVNGLLQNKGTDANPSHGPICLQSEGSPIEFRNIYLEPVP